MRNLLIEASAGTGKTETLARHIIDLLRQGVRPQEIVALTFSRAAAGEIFERLVTLLAQSATTDARDAHILRDLIATQHLSQIGTLDSFLMRIVRAFPLELGLTGNLELMDPFVAEEARNAVSFSLLRRTGAEAKQQFVEAFAHALDDANVRSFVASYRQFISDWHERVLALPAPSAWGDVRTIWPHGAPCPLATAEDLRRAGERLDGLREHKAWPDFVAWVKGFRGSFSDARGFAKKFLKLENLFDEGFLEVDYNRVSYSFDSAESQAIREAFLAIFGFALRQKLALARGIYGLIAAYEKKYDQSVRQGGSLVFSDVPRLIARLSPADRLAIEYRLDVRIRAWALDEFQDTSCEQWAALENLLDEAKQSDGEKSVLVVGDGKQAIYGWRNGDVSIFRREKGSGLYALRTLDRSWRYGPAITEAINRVFTQGLIRDVFPDWMARTHETAKTKLTGFVQTVEASGRAMSDFVEPICHALQAVDPVRRGISAAILVRKNALGELLARALKRLGLQGVVWEGESSILDTPALKPFLDLVQLAEHPADLVTYRHFAQTRLAALKYPQGVPSSSEVSREFALLFTSKGLVRAFQELRALLPDDPAEAWDDFTEGRFVDMLRAAGRFELSMSAGTRLGDFEAYLGAQRKRNLAEPGKIKVMTIHRSKGLGFDYVLLPLYEPDALNRECNGPLLGENWILPDPGRAIVRTLPGLQAAWRLRKDRAEQEALCMYYVAMTRAKRALTIVLYPPARAKSDSVRFSDLVRAALTEPIGEPAWYRDVTPPANVSPCVSRPATSPAFRRAKRTVVVRRLPSAPFEDRQCAGDLFRTSRRSSAMQRGSQIHAAYARVDFDDWLVKPEGFSGLWRERAFELMDGSAWVSGRFDRVVFTGEGANRSAVIYDFKTNRNTRHLPAEDFERELAERYAGQMAAYKRALAHLTGIPTERIQTQILLAPLTREP